MKIVEQGMTTSYRADAPDQSLLLPASLREWLPERHWVYFISDAVDALDLAALSQPLRLVEALNLVCDNKC